jgi:hypothetical protein
MSALGEEQIRDEFLLGGRFAFDRNRRRFLRTADKRSIRQAELRLLESLSLVAERRRRPHPQRREIVSPVAASIALGCSFRK